MVPIAFLLGIQYSVLGGGTATALHSLRTRRVKHEGQILHPLEKDNHWDFIAALEHVVLKLDERFHFHLAAISY